MARDVNHAIQRTRQYWYDDGLTEIGAGLLFLAMGALFLAEALSPEDSLPRKFSAAGVVVLVAGGLWLVNWGVRLAKRRITYPRTGFVSYRRPARTPQQRMALAALAFGVAILTSALLKASAPSSLAWIPMMQGVFIGAFILYVGHFAGLARFYVLAVASFLTGSAASVAGLGDTLGNGVYFLVMGLGLTASGAITLASYLRRTEPPEEE